MRIDAPRVLAPNVEGLVEAPPEQALDLAGTDGCRIEDAVIDGVRRAEVTYRESEFLRLRIARTRMPGCRFLDVRFRGLDAQDLDANGSTWRDTEILESRLGSVLLGEARISGLRLERCKIGYLGLVGGEVTDLVLEGCTIDELDLSDAELTRVAIPDSRIGLLRVTGSRLRHVDLRAGRIADVTPAAGLRGAALGIEQVLDLAPRMAAELGILVD